MSKLGGSQPEHEHEVDALNWMGALELGLERLGERPSVPPGASCSFDQAGVATILDPSSRRRFVLTPLTEVATAAPTPAADPVPAPAPAAAAPKDQATENRAAPPDSRPQPGATSGERTRPSNTSSAQNAQAAPAASSSKRKFQTVAYVDGAPGVNVQSQASAQPRSAPGGTDLRLLRERSDDPTEENPLRYIEQAYAIAAGMTVPAAEAALRWKLAEVQKQAESLPKGVLANLAVFDHEWRDAPQRPPLITLQWRDWSGDVSVDYPAAAIPAGAQAKPPVPAAPAVAPAPARHDHDDRLADAFEALEGLSRLSTPVEGLDFCIGFLENSIPAEAASACIYDINTDELRFVALTGPGAADRQGHAIPRAAGLFGQALRNEGHATAFADVMLEPAYNPATDSRTGLDARNMLLCPVSRDGQLFGMLQLVNRRGGGFGAQDVNLLGYVSERLADFLATLRTQGRSAQQGR